MSLEKFLEAKTNSGVYPFHMPGHKRNPEFLTSLSPAMIDYTELDDTDDLHNASGILQEIMKKCAGLYNSRRSFICVGGSTTALLSAIYASTMDRRDILIARNCHKSVYNAMAAFDLKPNYVYPMLHTGPKLNLSLNPYDIELQLERNKNIGTVVITSPTYEGVVSNIPKIAEIVHLHGAILIVDEAHGAHLGFSNYFPKAAVTQGADIVVQSLHKTLPAVTQAAVLHICSENVDENRIINALRTFETSSPSYIIMSSIDNCLDILIKRRDSLFENLNIMLKNFYADCKALKNLKIIDLNEHIYGFDHSKIIISTCNCSINAAALKNILKKKYKIELEMAYSDYALAIATVCDTEEGFSRLKNALFEIDKTLKFSNKNCNKISLENAQTVISPYKAVRAETKISVLKTAIGEISADYIYAYPPGIPLIVPGEKITRSLCENADYLKSENIELINTSGLDNEKIATVKL